MGDRVDFPVRDYQCDAVGQIERLADYLNAVDAVQPNDDGTTPLPCDIAIELLKQLGPAMPELSRRAREAEAERDAARAVTTRNRQTAIAVHTKIARLLRNIVNDAEDYLVGCESLRDAQAWLDSTEVPKV